MPEICALDPDGDLVRHLRRTGQARPSLGWACNHTELFEFDLPGGITLASWAVPLARRLRCAGPLM